MLNNIFMFGNEYIDYLEKEKEYRTLTWYEYIYIWYYNNFEYIIVIVGLLLLGCIFYFEFYNNLNTINTQKGGNNNAPIMSLNEMNETIAKAEVTTGKEAENMKKQMQKNQKSKAQTDSQSTKNNKQGEGNKKNNKQGEGDKKNNKQGEGDKKNNKQGEGDKKNDKQGEGDKKGSSTTDAFKKTNKGLSKINKGVGKAGTATKQLLLANMGGFYKFFFTLFITFALGVFIMPTLVLAGLGFLTFLIIKNNITKLFTL